MAINEPSIEAKFESFAVDVAERGYAIMDDFIDAAECKLLLIEMLDLRAQGLMHKAGIGRAAQLQRDETVRGDEILWIEKQILPTPTTQFLVQLEALIDYFNQSCFAGIRDYEAHFAAYAPGTFYKRHLDQFKGRGNRRFTFIFYLNADWLSGDGGELQIYIPSEGSETSISITPISGRIVCFRSELFEHEVLPTLRFRNSITGWWLDREKNLTFLH